MPIKEPYTASDGYGAFLSCDTNKGALQLGNGMFAKGINVSVRGGVLSTRPGFQDLGILGSGTFQGAKAYSLDEADYLVFAVSGKVYVRDSVGTVHPIDGQLALTGMVYFTQVYRWMVCQDGSSRPIVVEETGGVFSRVERDVVLDSPAEAPSICLVPGTVGAYAHGRYHYAPSILPELLPTLEMNKGQTEYVNLDVLPVDSEESGRAAVLSTDVLDNLDPYTVFRLSEHRVLNEGGAYSLPAELGFVQGMGSMRGAATGTGVGGLFVFGSRGVSAFDFSAPRSEWKNVALSQVAFTGAGTRSHRSIINVNDDLWYLGADGHLRSVNYDASQLSSGGGAALANTVKSIEATRWVRLGAKDWLPSASACAADNRIHWTLAGGRALGSIELAQAYSINPEELPARHEGIYTGFDFLQVLSMEGVLHAVVLNGDSEIRLLALGEGGTDPNSTPIKAELVTREFPFVYNEASTLREYKTLISMSLFLGGIDRATVFAVEYRPGHMGTWTEMGTVAVNVPDGSAPQSRRLTFCPDMTRLDAGNPVTKQPPWMGNSFAFRIRWTGRASIVALLADASIQEAVPEGLCFDDNPDNASLPVEVEDDFEYSVQLGDLA